MLWPMTRLNVTTNLKKGKQNLQVLLWDSYIKVLPKMIVKQFRKYQDCIYNMQTINRKGVLFHCTHYKVPQGSNIYTNYKAYKKEAKPMNLQIDHCPGKMMVAITQGGTVSLLFFPTPFHTCGALSTTKNIHLGDLDVCPLLEMISPTIIFKDVLTATICQAIVNVLSSNMEMWHGLNGGKFHGINLQKFVLDLESNH
jgi:hypothetical protein